MPETLLKTSLLILLWTLMGCEAPNRSAHDRKNENDAIGQRQDDSETPAPITLMPASGFGMETDPELPDRLPISDSISCGAEPKTEAAFRQLAEQGIRVILSVDGARPRIELAEKYGLRYVHIPIGYDGIDDEAARLFARAADELKDAVYVHCHHGQHRGPAAAAVMALAKGELNVQQALQALEQAGTSKEYAGLWRDVANYHRPAPDVLLPELESVAAVDSLAAAMAQIDRVWDHLKSCQAENWQTPKNHPDLLPAQESLLLKEAFHETIRQLVVADQTDHHIVEWLSESEDLANQLGQALRAGERPVANSTFAAIQQRCQRCHATYRDDSESPFENPGG